MVARGEAVGGEEAERLEAERLGGSAEGPVDASTAPHSDTVDDNDGELARR
jgi:hypothetical protein